MGCVRQNGAFVRDGDNPYRFVSEKALPAKQLAALLKERLPVRECCSRLIIDGEGSQLGFPELEEYSPYGLYPGNLEKIFLWIPPQKDGSRQFQESMSFGVSRQGHDGIANGGSYGWYRRIWSDGKISVARVHDRSSAQHGNRINYHHDDYEAVVTIANGSWAVVKYYYVGQIYSHPDDWECFGEPPKNFQRYASVVV